MSVGRRYIFVFLLSIPLLFLLYYVAFGPSDTDSQPPNGIGIRNALQSSAGQGPQINWKTVNLITESVPDSVKEAANKIVVQDNTVQIDNVKVYYKEATPLSKEDLHISVLLLHGAAFSSKTWLDLGTLKLVAAMGYKVIAIDIPGFGESPKASISDKSAFLSSVIDNFHLKNPVIVSPSMSGYFSLPYLLKNWQKMGGYVPVAPVGIEVLQKKVCTDGQNEIDTSQVYAPLQKLLTPPLPNLSCIKVPTLVVFGEKDRSLSSALLSLLPNSQAAEIPRGGHPAYLDNPELWHQLLYNFLKRVSAFTANKQHGLP